MREIKFRGLGYNNKWVFGVPIDYIENSFNRNNQQAMVSEVSCDELDYWVSSVDYQLVKKETVGQFTGLKDKNDVEIYEGDLLKLSYEYGGEFYNPLVVESGYACFQLYPILNVNNKIPFTNISIDYYEVIGNIHENPELLEVL